MPHCPEGFTFPHANMVNNSGDGVQQAGAADRDAAALAAAKKAQKHAKKEGLKAADVAMAQFEESGHVALFYLYEPVGNFAQGKLRNNYVPSQTDVCL